MPPSPQLKDLKAEITLLHKIIEVISASDNLSELLQEMAKVLCENLKGDSAFIYLADPSAAGLTLWGAWPPHPSQVGKLRLAKGEGLTGWVASHNKPLAITRGAYRDSRFKLFQSLPEDKFEAFLSVPIIMRSQTIGVINIQNRKTRVVSKSAIKLLCTTAAQIAGAIEKTRLMEMVTRRARQIEAISRLSTSIVTNEGYLQEILQLIVTLTAQMMDSKICSLMLLDAEKNELTITATQSLSDEYRKKPALKTAQSISGKAILTLRPVAVLDVTRDPAYSYPEIARREGLKSMLAVPMLIKNKPIGVINCYTTVPHTFNDEEIGILQTIANQAAVAVENTRLIEESRNAKEALETRKLVERAKGILMKERQMTEEESFQFIQKQAMNMRRTMREIAEALLLTEGLKRS